MSVISIQTEFRPALPTVYTSKDYHEFRQTLEEMDRILCESGVENQIISRRMKELSKDNHRTNKINFKTCFRALRYSILLSLTQYSYRELSIRVADSQLFQWFTHTAEIDEVRPVSKSTIERFEKMFQSSEINELIHLVHRIGTPEAFLNKMNKLCIEMTHTRKRKGGKKMRKTILRRMKRLSKTISNHAQNYHSLLNDRWSETEWSEHQAQSVLELWNAVDDMAVCPKRYPCWYPAVLMPSQSNEPPLFGPQYANHRRGQGLLWPPECQVPYLGDASLGLPRMPLTAAWWALSPFKKDVSFWDDYHTDKKQLKWFFSELRTIALF